MRNNTLKQKQKTKWSI